MLALVLLAATALAWAPTKCGPGNQITSWGKTVTPNSVLPEYPRPQMARATSTYHNMNGLWQFQPSSAGEENSPPFGKTLTGEILVPFPVESCLSGVGITYKYLWYRSVFALPSGFAGTRILLHFGAVDWRCDVYVDTHKVGSHEGGFDSFYFDITSSLSTAASHEIIVWVYDPSDDGYQVNGKQRISAIPRPGGDTYTPSSGIWQTVWLESVPTSTYISSLKITPTMTSVSVVVTTAPVATGAGLTISAKDANGNVVASGSGNSGDKITLTPSSPHLWSPTDPYLYTMDIKLNSPNTDAVSSYFALREFKLVDINHPGNPMTGPQVGIDRAGSDMANMPVTLPSADYNLCWQKCNTTAGCTAWAYAVQSGSCSPNTPQCWLKNGHPGTGSNGCRVSGDQGTSAGRVKRPSLNGKLIFLSGWLDQSFWPDGLFAAPTDAALEFDLQVVKTFGMNTVRLHQKVNSERWYYHADRLGIIILQDMPQKYGGASASTVQPFKDDMTRMINGKYNHPCIVQWTTFNEGDCYGVFDVPSIVSLARSLDPTRPVDTDSGGGANDLHIGDVNDIHTYPWPGYAIPSTTQYGMLGEYGGMGAYVSGHEWVPGQCQSYMASKDPEEECTQYLTMQSQIKARIADISCAIYTQITDLERECDGFLNYDRTSKFNADQTKRLFYANQDLINTVVPQ